jgi:hypothetical protein
LHREEALLSYPKTVASKANNCWTTKGYSKHGQIEIKSSKLNEIQFPAILETFDLFIDICIWLRSMRCSLAVKVELKKPFFAMKQMKYSLKCTYNR